MPLLSIYTLVFRTNCTNALVRALQKNTFCTSSAKAQVRGYKKKFEPLSHPIHTQKCDLGNKNMPRTALVRIPLKWLQTDGLSQTTKHPARMVFYQRPKMPEPKWARVFCGKCPGQMVFLTRVGQKFQNWLKNFYFYLKFFV